MKRIIVVLVLFVVYLIADSQAYYYGMGKGFLSIKIPKEFRLYNYVPYLQKGRLTIREKVPYDENMGSVSMVDERGYLQSNDGGLIKIKQFLGYYFNKKYLVAEILDDKNKVRYVRMYGKRESYDAYRYYEDEIKKTDIDENYKYINISGSEEYLGWLVTIKRLSLIIAIFMTIYLLIKGILRTSLFDSKIDYN